MVHDKHLKPSFISTTVAVPSSFIQLIPLIHTSQLRLYLSIAGTRADSTVGRAKRSSRQTIKVTCVKSMESISFLDVTLYKGPNFIRNGTLDYRTHIKVTNVRSYVHSNSYHARGTRKGIIVGEIHRYHKTNSSNIHFWNQVRAHVQALVRRGYHMVEIKYHVRETLTKIAIESKMI